MSMRPLSSRPGLVAALALVSLLTPSLALADGGGMPAPPTSGSPSWSTPPDAKMSKEDADKVHAVELYSQAYREVDKAKAELAEAAQLKASADPKAAKKATDKTASAQKRLTGARDKFGQVTTLDATNADGWNMLGFTRRKSGDHQGAFDAYWKCLALKPEHFGAHEYMGEAYLEEGKLNEARAELTWLKKRGNMTTMETKNLETSINDWVAANPDAAAKSVIGQTASAPAPTENAVAPVTTAAAPDSSK